MRDRRYTPLTNSRPLKGQAPSSLADLNGNRKSGGQINFKIDKPPKQRFKIGELFEYDGSIWELIYMYRVYNEKGVWFHYLEEREDLKPNQKFIADAFEMLGAGSTTPRVVITAFASHNDANVYFSDIYRRGSGSIKTTQQLLKLKKVR